jgi:hypothetical protein
MTKRIQRKRTKGWRLPANAKCVDRSTKFGNPFDWQDYVDQWTTECQARQHAKDDYRRWLNGEINRWTIKRDWILEHLEDLRGFDLACWCPLAQACHADVLIEMLEARQ